MTGRRRWDSPPEAAGTARPVAPPSSSPSAKPPTPTGSPCTDRHPADKALRCRLTAAARFWASTGVVRGRRLLADDEGRPGGAFLVAGGRGAQREAQLAGVFVRPLPLELRDAERVRVAERRPDRPQQAHSTEDPYDLARPASAVERPVAEGRALAVYPPDASALTCGGAGRGARQAAWCPAPAGS